MAATLKSLANIFGLLQEGPTAFLQAGALDADSIAKRIEERVQARLNRDFMKADAIRKELLAEGIELEDGPEGTTWRQML